MGFGLGFGDPYTFCRRFPWLPRWWWSGIYRPLTPYAAVNKEQETAILEDQRKRMEEALEQIKKRLEELKKEEGE
jgi:prephenate dehydrogenase